jgi:serine/threonine protein kinase
MEGRLCLASSLHFGVGCEIDLDEAGDYYEATFESSLGIRSSDLYRCLRALGKAKFPRTRLGAPSETKATEATSSTKGHPHVGSLRPSDYLEDAHTTRSGPLIGVGGSSAVSVETNEDTHERIAVKRFFESTFDQTTFIREVEALAHLTHPCVLRIRGWKPPIGRAPAEIWTSIAENGALSEILGKVRRGAQFPFWNATGKGILIIGIALGMRFIHSKGMIHGDLKPSNILLNSRWEAVISDFGLSRFENNDYTLDPEGGTVHYAAPELFDDGTMCTRQVDVYGFGLLMYEILTGFPVFPASEYAFPTMKRIQNEAKPDVPPECGSLMQYLIPHCWSMDPAKRPSFDEIIGKFREAQFRILPRADEVRLALFVNDIEAWEATDVAHSVSLNN